MVRLTKSRSRNARSRARTGPMTCERSAGVMSSYHCQNPSNPSGSSRSTVISARNCAEFSSGGMCCRVTLACLSRVGVEQHDPVGDPGGEPVQHVEDEVAVRVDDHGAPTSKDPVNDHIC